MSDHQASRYREAKDIANQAMDVPAHQRIGFLDSRCGDDRELRQEVDWLLGTMETQGDAFLKHDPLRAVEPEAEDILQIKSPRDYRILRRLGEGGYGVVFLAERSDGKYRQQVALKLLNFAGQLSPAMTARFLAEGQILARLNHPNIAHLIDAGTLPDGQPFLAMEFVDGTPITRYCDEHRLDVRERVRLFLKVCAAVGYAHQQLVIHRDLKPANILVAADGEPKLLDFGIARLMAAQDDIAVPPTVEGQQLLTLIYASPEQVRGEPLSTTTDVYSLGVVLYELLTGVPPFSGSSDKRAQLSRDICETEPQRPSRRTGDSGRHSAPAASGSVTGLAHVPADLDAIVLKALRKRPEERYGSVHALADDLGRYLSNRPVAARKGRMAYRARRFLQRNRWAVAAASAFVLLVGAFAIDRQMQLQRTQTEREVAERINAFMTDSFAVLDPAAARGRTVTAREVLDNASSRIHAASVGSPEVEARLLDAMSTAYHKIGSYEKSAELRRNAIDVWSRLGAPREDSLAASRVALATSLVKLDHVPDAEKIIDAVLPDLEKLKTVDGSLLASALTVKAQAVASRKKDFDEANAYFVKAADAARDPVSEASARLAHARWLSADGRYKEAAQQIELATRVLSDIPGDDHPLKIDARSAQANIYTKTGDYRRASQLKREELENLRRLYGADNVRFATTAYSLGATLNGMRQFSAAEHHLRKAKAYFDSTAGAHHVDDLWRTELNLEVALREQGKLDESEPLLQHMLELAKKTYGENDQRYAYGLWSLGNTRLAQNRHAEAAESFRRASEILLTYGDRHLLDRASLESQQAQAFIQMGNYAQALRHAEDAVRMRAGAPDLEPWLVDYARLNSGIAKVGLGRTAEGNQMLRASHDEIAAALGPCDESAQLFREFIDEQRPRIAGLQPIGEPEGCANLASVVGESGK